MIALVGKTESSVLITGESGTGKELVAEEIHGASRRSDRPLVKLNCSALPETLLESELFGHVKGSFTGAVKDSFGRFKAADGGTLFLDEIGDISPMVQVKLLRVLESKEFNRIGESLPMKVDVRIIAATNQNLPGLIHRRLFREDLYYRLNVVEIKVPPLRERKEDIPLLVNHFVAMLNLKSKKSISTVSDDVMGFFLAHSWPGNVRELAHVLEHASVVCQQEIICLHHLPPELQKKRILSDWVPEQKGGQESDRLEEVLLRTGGNKARAARALGIDRKTLYRRIKKFNVPTTL
jgi:transcriptional regulator with PAS, ATPase and Fis domain